MLEVGPSTGSAAGTGGAAELWVFLKEMLLKEHFSIPGLPEPPQLRCVTSIRSPKGHTLALCPSLVCRCKTRVLRSFFESGTPGTELQSPFPVPATPAGREGSALPQPGRGSAMSSELLLFPPVCPRYHHSAGLGLLGHG